MSRSNQGCCVVNCNATANDKNVKVHLYSFPNRPWEVERKNTWVAAVRRLTNDGKPWYPTKHSKICSLHFIGGEKSNDPRKEAYNPTIFPSIYHRKRTKCKQTAYSNKKRKILNPVLPNDIPTLRIYKPGKPRNLINDVEIQVDLLGCDNQNIPDMMFCCMYKTRSKHEAQTQTNIIYRVKKENDTITHEPNYLNSYIPANFIKVESNESYKMDPE